MQCIIAYLQGAVRVPRVFAVRCRVVAWEPVPQFRRFLEYGLQLNGFLGAVEVRHSAVADVDGALYTLQVTRVWQP